MRAVPIFEHAPATLWRVLGPNRIRVRRRTDKHRSWNGTLSLIPPSYPRHTPLSHDPMGVLPMCARPQFLNTLSPQYCKSVCQTAPPSDVAPINNCHRTIAPASDRPHTHPPILSTRWKGWLPVRARSQFLNTLSPQYGEAVCPNRILVRRRADKQLSSNRNTAPALIPALIRPSVRSCATATDCAGLNL